MHAYPACSENVPSPRTIFDPNYMLSLFVYELCALSFGACSTTMLAEAVMRPYSCLAARDSFPSYIENKQALKASVKLAVDPTC